jgi:hypothetical protein
MSNAPIGHAKRMFNPNYDPYDRLADMETALTYTSIVLEKHTNHIKNLSRVVEKTTKMNRELAKAMEHLYAYTEILDEEIKELREQQAAGRELRK